MAKNPETLLKEKVLADLKALPRTWAEKIQQVAKRGTPDVLACVAGHFVALELKRDESIDPDPLQAHTMDRIKNRAGGVTYVVHPLNWPHVLAALRRLAHEPLTSEEVA